MRPPQVSGLPSVHWHYWLPSLLAESLAGSSSSEMAYFVSRVMLNVHWINQHHWFGNRKSIQSVKPLPLSLKSESENEWRKKNSQNGKRLIKQRRTWAKYRQQHHATMTVSVIHNRVPLFLPPMLTSLKPTSFTNPSYHRSSFFQTDTMDSDCSPFFSISGFILVPCSKLIWFLWASDCMLLLTYHFSIGVLICETPLC